jgi:hypothetical protein
MTLCVACAFFPPASVRAEIKIVKGTGRYHLGDNDTRLDGHRLALLEAKRDALEKAGTYVESITEVKDFQLTRDDIRTYTAGIVSVEETSEPKWEMIGQTLRVTVNVDARVDTGVVTERIAALRENADATRELKEEQAKAKANEQKIAELNRQLRAAKKGSPEAERARAARDDAFAGIDGATLRAQAAAAASFSRATWDKTRNYVNQNVDLRGCMPFKTKTAARAGGPRYSGLWLVGTPALALALARPRRRRSDPGCCRCGGFAQKVGVVGTGVSSTTSYPRTRVSRWGGVAPARWIPAFAGMTSGERPEFTCKARCGADVDLRGRSEEER